MTGAPVARSKEKKACFLRPTSHVRELGFRMQTNALLVRLTTAASHDVCFIRRLHVNFLLVPIFAVAVILGSGVF